LGIKLTGYCRNITLEQDLAFSAFEIQAIQLAFSIYIRIINNLLRVGMPGWMPAVGGVKRNSCSKPFISEENAICEPSWENVGWLAKLAAEVSETTLKSVST